VLVVGQDGKVSRKNVVTERLEGGDWIVGSGLASGDRVIVSGLQRAQPGQPAKATPVPPDKAEKPAAAAPAAAKG
jgi:membrane fusion protein (multidrug efflux system)